MYVTSDSSVGCAYPAEPGVLIMIFSCCAPLPRLAGDHRHGEARDTDELVLLVPDLDVPDLAAATDMVGARRRRHEPCRDGTKVIRVDLLAEAHLRGPVDTQVCGNAPDGLGQGDRCTAMQHAGGLMGVRIDGHGRAQEVRAAFGEADIDVLGERIARVLLNLRYRRFGTPDPHRW